MMSMFSPWNRLFFAAAAALACSVSTQSLAEDEPAVAEAPTPLFLEIDRLIAEGTPNYDAIAAPVASDAEFLRRVTLDLTGLLPAIEETRAFLADTDPNKREKAIDRLLADPAYARQMQRAFDVMLMRRLPGKHVPVPEWEAFLRNSFAENKPWDQLVREILSADGTDPKQRGPARFALDREGDSNELTRDVARIFLGANIECAQCHDHPTIDDYRQAHYYGLQAFFVRTFLHTDEKKLATLAEKGEGEVTFESVFDIRDKKSRGPKSSAPLIFEKASFTEPKFDKGQEYVVAPNDKKKEIRPVPKFSRRSHLPSALTSRENPRFARNGVNRIWAMLLGRGLVHPVDQDHAQNPASHPALLSLLTEEFVRSRYDVKAMVRQIALSKTYQRASQRALGADGKVELPPEKAFAQALLRPLSPAQFAWSICTATGDVAIQKSALGPKATEDALHARLVGYENEFVRHFGGQPGKPIENLEATIDQALWLSNNTFILNLLSPRPASLSERLLKLPAENAAAIAEELYLSVLIRQPTPEESAEVSEYLKDQTGEPRINAVKDLIWALIMSSEFRVVH